jgi:hypothetical protein
MSWLNNHEDCSRSPGNQCYHFFQQVHLQDTQSTLDKRNDVVDNCEAEFVMWLLSSWYVHLLLGSDGTGLVWW